MTGVLTDSPPGDLLDRGHIERRAVFENPENDFPTRITYHRVGEANLVVTLDQPGVEGEGPQVFRFVPVE